MKIKDAKIYKKDGRHSFAKLEFGLLDLPLKISLWKSKKNETTRLCYYCGKKRGYRCYEVSRAYLKIRNWKKYRKTPWKF